MKLRAIIFDLYGTLLAVGPAPANAEENWAATWHRTLGMPPRLTLEGFHAACRRAVATEHAAARARGIAFPEVHWPGIVDRVLPEFQSLPATVRHALPFYDASLQHTVALQAGVPATLRAAQQASLHLGLASNCQPYSMTELGAALAAAGLSLDVFHPQLTFLSFEHGFSKPDPHVFCILTARLRQLGVAPEEAMMVGDRADHDLEPARAHGWQAFLISARAAEDWSRLRNLLPPPTPGPG